METFLAGGSGMILSFLGWFIVFYLYHGLGITLGYHRFLTHKSLRLPRWLNYLVVSGGYLVLMGSPAVWVGVHRLHHQKADAQGDPHSPLDGFLHSLCGWMFHMEETQTIEDLHKQSGELLQDPVYRLLGTDHKPRTALLCFGINIAYRCLVVFLLGWIALAANLAASMGVFWSTQLVNSVCHLQGVGYRRYSTRDESRNVWWVGLLGLGEGWHNNHHAAPKAARHGLVWWEIDVTWYAIWLLEKIGLAHSVVRPSKPALQSVLPQAHASQLANQIDELRTIKEEVMMDQVYVLKPKLEMRS